MATATKEYKTVRQIIRDQRINSQEMLLKMLFPIPSSPLRVGESVSSPRAVPFNAMGSLLEVTGSSVTTLTGYVGLDGKTCARL